MTTHRKDDDRNQGSSRQASGREDSMSVREAGQMGGERVRELVEEGKRSEGGSESRRSSSGRDREQDR